MKPKRKDWHTLLEDTQLTTNDFQMLTIREMLVCGCALLNDGLVDVMKKRLVDVPEADKYLGIDGGFLPFGQLITFALLTGGIDKNHAETLREFAKLRNLAAHTVEFDITSDEATAIMSKIANRTVDFLVSGGGGRQMITASLKPLRKQLKDESSARSLLHGLLSISLSRNAIILDGMERIVPNNPFKRHV